MMSSALLILVMYWILICRFIAEEVRLFLKPVIFTQDGMDIIKVSLVIGIHTYGLFNTATMMSTAELWKLPEKDLLL